MLSKNLRYLRIKGEFSQRGIAALINIPFKCYQSYELGYSKPGIDTLLHLSKFYALDVYELMYEDISKHKESKASAADQFFAKYQQQPNNIKQAIDKLLSV